MTLARTANETAGPLFRICSHSSKRILFLLFFLTLAWFISTSSQTSAPVTRGCAGMLLLVPARLLADDTCNPLPGFIPTYKTVGYEQSAGCRLYPEVFLI